jgi:hypothetical protein
LIEQERAFFHGASLTVGWVYYITGRSNCKELIPRSNGCDEYFASLNCLVSIRSVRNFQVSDGGQMKSGCKYALAFFLGIFAVSVWAQESPSVEISPGFKVRPDGVIDIGPLFAEVNYYDTDWAISQQHDKFQLASPDANAPSTQPVTPGGAQTFTGILTTAQGPANLTETLVPIDGGLNYSATFASAKELATDELSVAFLLPVESFSGKQVTIDGDSTTFPADAPKKGESLLTVKEEAHEVDLQTPNGTLTLKGSFKVLVQDDREWGDTRYSMRVMFTPNSGAIKESKVELQMRLKAAAK